MTEHKAEKGPAVERPADCRAEPIAQFFCCDRCATAWEKTDGGRPCVPITGRRLRALAERRLLNLEASFRAVAEIARDDPRAADPVPALTAVAEMRAIVRLLNLVLDNPAILAILKKAPK